MASPRFSSLLKARVNEITAILAQHMAGHVKVAAPSTPIEAPLTKDVLALQRHLPEAEIGIKVQLQLEKAVL